MAGTDQLSRVFSALADPTRRAILAELAERDATVTELSAPFPMSMPAVSRHLKVLEEAALISRRRSGKWRASHLETAPLREAADWIDRFRRFWNLSLDRLAAHLAAGQAPDRPRKREDLCPQASHSSPSHAFSTHPESWHSGPSPIRITSRRGGARAP